MWTGINPCIEGLKRTKKGRKGELFFWRLQTNIESILDVTCLNHSPYSPNPYLICYLTALHHSPTWWSSHSWRPPTLTSTQPATLGCMSLLWVLSESQAYLSLASTAGNDAFLPRLSSLAFLIPFHCLLN